VAKELSLILDKPKAWLQLLAWGTPIYSTEANQSLQRTNVQKLCGHFCFCVFPLAKQYAIFCGNGEIVEKGQWNKK
jgi:hypothetical protein